MTKKMQKIKPLLKIAPKQVPKITKFYLCLLCQRWINILTTAPTTKKNSSFFSCYQSGVAETFFVIHLIFEQERFHYASYGYWNRFRQLQMTLKNLSIHQVNE